VGKKQSAVVTPDPKVVAAAVKRVTPLVKKFPKDLQLGAKEIEKHALAGAAVVHRKKSSEEVGGAVVFGGDLVIDGSFDVACVCVVLGNLTVEGVLTAGVYETFLVVGGSIRARGVICRGQIRAAGSIEAEVIFVETGSQLAAKAIVADLVIRESDASAVEGKVSAKTKIDLTYPAPKGLQQLERVLHPKAFGTVDGDDTLYDFTNLEGALRRGKPWRRRTS
jgi:hypothetical protein